MLEGHGIETYSTWLKVGKNFKCGCCGKMPTFVDILDLKTCPHCQHMMRWYETDHGVYPLKFQGGENQNGEQENS